MNAVRACETTCWFFRTPPGSTASTFSAGALRKEHMTHDALFSSELLRSRVIPSSEEELLRHARQGRNPCRSLELAQLGEQSQAWLMRLASGMLLFRHASAKKTIESKQLCGAGKF